jgi:hypothetical protein
MVPARVGGGAAATGAGAPAPTLPAAVLGR